MRIRQDDDGEIAYGGRFTGDVRLQMLEETGDDTRPDVARVSFADGAVTYWHSHPGGQRLYVLDGSARVGTQQDGELVLEPGSFVETPPNERHYHGARAGHHATLLALTWGATEWESEPPR